MKYYFGFDIFGWIFWFSVSPEKFGKKVAPLLLHPGQMATVSGAELLPFFQTGLILRDDWRLYRALPRE